MIRLIHSVFTGVHCTLAIMSSSYIQVPDPKTTVLLVCDVQERFRMSNQQVTHAIKAKSRCRDSRVRRYGRDYCQISQSCQGQSVAVRALVRRS
jgi:hypothetical protein